jgi:hypothetical protein
LAPAIGYLATEVGNAPNRSEITATAMPSTASTAMTPATPRGTRSGARVRVLRIDLNLLLTSP